MQNSSAEAFGALAVVIGIVSGGIGARMLVEVIRYWLKGASLFDRRGLSLGFTGIAFVGAMIVTLFTATSVMKFAPAHPLFGLTGLCVLAPSAGVIWQCLVLAWQKLAAALPGRR